MQPMADTLLVQRIEEYTHYSTTTTNGVQIIFQGNIGSNNIGHYVCVHYVLNRQTVYIYDSLYNGSGFVDDPKHKTHKINANTRKVIHTLYPQHLHRVVVRPRTTQPDLKSCGVFAIAYVTTVLFNLNPAIYSLKLGASQLPQSYDQSIDLRFHLANIIQNENLQVFPSP